MTPRIREWTATFCGNDPVYLLPTEVIVELAGLGLGGSGSRVRESFLGEGMKECEEEFARLCRSVAPGCVGVWGELPIIYPPFDESNIMDGLSQDVIRDAGWTSKQTTMLQIHTTNYDSRSRQMLGYAGYLICNSNYREELRGLRRIFDSLADPPPFPLRANTHDKPEFAVQEAPEERVLSPESIGFVESVGRFMRKWGVASLRTWELPEPQGQLQGVPVDLVRSIYGPEALIDAHPIHFNLPSRENLREHIQSQQRSSATTLGHGSEFPPKGICGRKDESSRYQTAYRCWLIESTVRRRYGNPTGILARLSAAFCGMFKTSPDFIRDLRRRLYRDALSL